jgi:hypothetical protein
LEANSYRRFHKEGDKTQKQNCFTPPYCQTSSWIYSQAAGRGKVAKSFLAFRLTENLKKRAVRKGFSRATPDKTFYFDIFLKKLK